MIESVPNKPNMVKVTCDGGCGRSVVLRRKKMVKGLEYYVCNSKKNDISCEKKLPAVGYGNVRYVIPEAAANFTGCKDFKLDDVDKLALKQGVNGLNGMIADNLETGIAVALNDGKFLRKRDVKLEYYPDMELYIAHTEYNESNMAYIMPIVSE